MNIQKRSLETFWTYSEALRLPGNLKAGTPNYQRL